MTTTMTMADLVAAERRYDAIHNEGGEGYNPHRAERQDRERQMAAAMPRTRDSILRDLERLDCSIARESGTYDEVKVSALRAELAAMDKADNDAFAAIWTRDVTLARREAWNAEIKAMAARNGNKCPSREINALVARLGYDHNDIRRARALHGIEVTK